MIWATEYKHVDLVKLLLSKGSDINIRDNVSVPAAAGRQCRGGAGPGPGAERRRLFALVVALTSPVVARVVQRWFWVSPVAGCSSTGRRP